jgi:STE24 endopeptidase
MRILNSVLAVLFLSSIVLHAALPPGSSARTNETATARSFDAASATRAWLETIPADKRAKSDAYFEGGYWLLLWNFLLGAAIFLFLLTSGVSARLRAFAEKTTRFKALQVALYTIPYVLIVSFLSSPLAIYSEYFREHKYGLATQTVCALVRGTAHQPDRADGGGYVRA